MLSHTPLCTGQSVVLRVENRSSDALILSWTIPAVEQLPVLGVELSYYACSRDKEKEYRELGAQDKWLADSSRVNCSMPQDDRRVKQLLPPQSTVTRLSGLSPFTPYALRVRLTTAERARDSLSEVSVRTMEASKCSEIINHKKTSKIVQAEFSRFESSVAFVRLRVQSC